MPEVAAATEQTVLYSVPDIQVLRPDSLKYAETDRTYSNGN